MPQVKAVLMPGAEVRGQYQLRLLSARLRAAGTEGKGLRRELFQAVTRATRPLVNEIKSPEHLHAYMPDNYADTLAADLSVTTSKSTSRNPGISIKARGRRHARKVKKLEAGVLTHPLFGSRKHWYTQAGGMRPGFFADACERAAPGIRAEILAAMHDVGKKITND